MRHSRPANAFATHSPGATGLISRASRTPARRPPSPAESPPNSGRSRTRRVSLKSALTPRKSRWHGLLGGAPGIWTLQYGFCNMDSTSLDDSLLEEMRLDWDKRARKNARHRSEERRVGK